MSVSTVGQIIERIKSAAPVSPIAVFTASGKKNKGKLNVFFGATLESERLAASCSDEVSLDGVGEVFLGFFSMDSGRVPTREFLTKAAKK